MKKKLESELISIAHRILKLKGKEDVVKMHTEVSALYETLTVLKFAHENFEEDIPTIGSDSSFFDMLDTAFNNKISDTIEVEDKIYINLDEVKDDDIMEPVMNKIKDMVSHMPDDVEDIDIVFEDAIPEKKGHQNNLDDITAGFENTPIFEPVSKSDNGLSNEKKSLNDKIKKGRLDIGLNDKIAFIKQLFDGRNEDYDRVISQLNTIASYTEAKKFIEEMVKPDYNNWNDLEEFETRFMEIVERKFE
ncbi:hypothetical protein [Aestuariivivens sediminis]|uniref:hypothetical protein n=1 Tax=Aestuariivivens sediminis TaxID=2913557 RepID=UPI001F5AA45B|nr:hypothetical protein [Aestuariivivens sediminis]